MNLDIADIDFNVYFIHFEKYFFSWQQLPVLLS